MPANPPSRRLDPQRLFGALANHTPPLILNRMLKLRHEADDRPDHFQVYTGQVLIGAIYKTGGNKWFWGLHGVQNGPDPFNGFVRTLDDAKAEFAASWALGSRLLG